MTMTTEQVVAAIADITTRMQNMEMYVPQVNQLQLAVAELQGQLKSAQSGKGKLPMTARRGFAVPKKYNGTHEQFGDW